MADAKPPDSARSSSTYRLVVRGVLSDRFDSAFAPLTIGHDDENTILTGAVRDQAQLHGLIGQIQELGLELVSAEQISVPALPGDTHGTAA